MKIIRLLFFAMIATALIAFSGCEKDDENSETTSSPLVGTWSDGNMRFVISESTIIQQQNRGDQGWFTLMEGTYTYNSTNNTITTNILKTNITENSGVVELPYTDEDMGVTWTKMTSIESVAFGEKDEQTVMMFKAYFGGNTSTLVGDWALTYSMRVEMEVAGETDVVNANMGASLNVGGSTMTLTINDIDTETWTPYTVTASANWTKDSNIITISGTDNNEYFGNGDYEYMIIGSGMIVEQQGPGTGLVYMVKQE
jgi:hypothetical protein